MAYERTWAGLLAARKAAGPVPCQDCPDRYPGCSGHCDRYKAWKADVEARKQAYMDKAQAVRDYTGTRFEAKEAAIRRSGDRVIQNKTGGIVHGRRR